MLVSRRALSGQALHVAVLAEEVVAALRPRAGQTLLDGTFGAGGHSRRLLAAVAGGPGLRLAAHDRDPAALALASRLSQDLLKDASPHSVLPLRGRLSALAATAAAAGLAPGSVDAVLMDLGPSSMQLDEARRGFALAHDGELDMRMDPSDAGAVTAFRVVNGLRAEELASLIRAYGDERQAARIAKAIVRVREELGPIRTTKELAALVGEVLGFGGRDSLGRRAHPATKTFQALRMFVNDELGEVRRGIREAWRLLRPATGRLALLSFHSTEDAVVKRTLRDAAPDAQGRQAPLWRPLHRKVIVPSEEEIAANPRARSAKLRVAIKQ